MEEVWPGLSQKCALSFESGVCHQSEFWKDSMATGKDRFFLLGYLNSYTNIAKPFEKKDQ